jgi:uncharacterized protein YcfJ
LSWTDATFAVKKGLVPNTSAARRSPILVRNKLLATATLVCSTLVVAAAPLVADAQSRHHRHSVQICTTSRGARNTGTVVGAVSGGLLGNALSSGGGRTGGTLIGAGVGAVAGHEIAKHNAHKTCHYEWR